ncbi:MAG: Gfo/Idh/MocA family oxidoreductase [Actinomycetota bacterium]|nr:Gfo/Idh/MocA family oxidoreductase [Actinomycetota bacterium]HZY65824.1 Gfo/Idh/MocA family oxidoreductase [Rubrobacteraceae bacterium]
MQNTPLRLGILGAANIARGAIIPAAGETDAVEVAAVATRGGKKADEVRDLAPEAGLFEDYGSLVESDEVDAVYIPLPNSMHVEWTLKALDAGKHVLCEKPFSLDTAGAEKAVEAAREAGLTLMEGFMFRLHPQTLRLRELIGDGAVGTVRQAIAQFGHLLDDPNDVRGVGSLGGGSLGDVGCYAVSGVRLVFGGEPRRASAFARFDEDDADRELAGVLEFDEGVGIVSCSISSARRERLEIIGTDGRITLDAPFRADKAGGTIEIQRGDETEKESFEEGEPYRAELEEFAAAIRENREPAVGPNEVLGNARAIGALLASAHQGGRSQSL